MASSSARRSTPAKAATARPAGGTGPAADPTTFRHPSAAPIKVRAIKMGYYGEKLRHVGDVFVLEKPRDEFSSKWMQEVSKRTPERVSGPQDAINREKESTLAARQRERQGIVTDVDNPEGATGLHNPLGDD